MKGFSGSTDEDGSRLTEGGSTLSLLATRRGCARIVSKVMTRDKRFIQGRFERPRGGITTTVEVASVSRSAFQSGLDGLLGSTEGSVTDSVYVDLLVVYRTVDA